MKWLEKYELVIKFVKLILDKEIIMIVNLILIQLMKVMMLKMLFLMVLFIETILLNLT